MTPEALAELRKHRWRVAIRPKTLWAGACPVFLGGALAIADGASHLPSIIACLIGALLIQIGTNFVNDYADGVKGTFAYLIGDSFAKLGLGMIADGTPIFGLTGWKGTFAALDTSAAICIGLLVFVAIIQRWFLTIWKTIILML